MIILFLHERQMLLDDILYVEIPGDAYEQRIQSHIQSNLNAHIIIWIIGCSIITLFNLRFLKLVKQNLYVQRKLSYAMDKFKTVFDNAKDHMYVLEIKDGAYSIIADVNKSALHELRYTAKELIGKPIDLIIDKASAKNRKERIERILNGEQLTFESVKVRKDNTTFPVEASVKMVKIGNKYFLHSVERNIEDRKIHEQELIAAKFKAEESDRLKTAFLTNMSHEIRTPMNGILGFAELLKSNNTSDEKRAEYIEMITASGKHLIRLINDIIDISKLEANKMSIENRWFKLNPFVKSVVSFFKPLVNNGVELKFQTELNDDQDIIFSDDTRLKQVLTNLIGNSLKFTESGFVEVSYRIDSNSEILFRIQDTGIGMTKDELAVVFKRFRQADERTKRKFGGTGLGLAISKACVHLLGGQIWVESEKR
jgi:PAS domain S-box-containing protein